MARIEFKNQKPKDLTLVLCTKDYRRLGQLTGIKSVRYRDYENSANELSFTITKHDLLAINGNTVDDIKLYQKIKKALWEQVEDFKVVWVKETNEYFEIKVSINDGLETSKSIIGTPIPESELSQILITAEINTESDIARDDYEITVFFDEQNPNASLLHRLFQKATGYTIKYVDDSLKRLQRMFSISDSYLYDFLVGECSEQFNCVFKFDSSDRSVSVYDLYTVCQDCGERGDYLDVCPNCGGKNLKSYGEDTTIYIDKNNLTDNITCEVNTDNVKNCFKLVAGDEYMTATIRNLNPSGSDYIYHIPEYLKKDMSSGLVERLDMYDTLYNSRVTEYEQLTEEVYELIDQITYLESGMMPTIENAKVTASTEAEKLNVMNLSPLGLYPFATSTSLATVNSAIKNYAKVYVKTGYVKLEVEPDATYQYNGTGSDGFKYGTWRGRFKVTNYSDEEDVAYSDYITVKVHGNNQEFVEQKILKAMSQDDEENSVFDVLVIDNLEDFKNALKLYCINRLESFENAIQSALNILISLDQASEDADLYYVLYTPYYEKLMACQKEKIIRQSSIDEIKTQLEEKKRQCSDIRKELDFETFLGEHYTEFALYRREDTYNNANYICDGLNNAEIIANAQKFIEVAKEELVRSSEQQVVITSSLYNLLLIPEFAPLVDKFETGNWLRIRVDGVLYKIRLLDYEINYDDLNNISVTFSNSHKDSTIDSEIQDILQSAKAMGQTYGFVAKQADKGNVAQDSIQTWIQDGLNTTLVQLKNNNHEEVTYGNHGILLKEHDDITNTYHDEQLKLTHNILAYTDNNWKTVKTALGKHKYVYYDNQQQKFVDSIGYGLSSDFVQSGIVVGSQIISGEIISQNYIKDLSGTYFNLVNGDFNIGGGNISYNNTDKKIKLKEVVIDWDSATKPDMEIEDIIGLDGALYNITNQLSSKIETWYQSTDPSINWNTDELKDLHIGDLWYNTTDNTSQRWNGIEWAEQEVPKSVFDKIDGKAQIFTSQPKPPYRVGDLYTEGQIGDILVCVTERLTGNYSSNDWKKASKYTDDSALTNFLNGNYRDDLESINGQIDKKAETWYQESDPSINWNTDELKDLHIGDLWYNIGESKSYMYTLCTTKTTDLTLLEHNSQYLVYHLLMPDSHPLENLLDYDLNGDGMVTTDDATILAECEQSGLTEYNHPIHSYQWEETDGVPDEVYDKIDGKAQIFTSQPKPPYRVGDLYTEGQIGDILVCVTERLTGNYSSNDWKKASKYTDDTKANSAYSLAENAKILGETLSDNLGFKTSITGEYVISPVIAGGTLLIGDKEGTYAEITSDGILNCNGADITGTIKATNGSFSGDITSTATISGGTIAGSTITGSKIVVKYTAPTKDLTKLEHNSTYLLYHTFTPEEYPLENPLDYDLDGDGVISDHDAILLNQCENAGLTEFTYSNTLVIDPDDNNLLRTDGVQINKYSIEASGSIKTNLLEVKSIWVNDEEKSKKGLGITQDVTIGNTVLKIINGVIVDVQ